MYLSGTAEQLAEILEALKGHGFSHAICAIEQAGL
jgi:hypothetical protein